MLEAHRADADYARLPSPDGRARLRDGIARRGGPLAGPGRWESDRLRATLPDGTDIDGVLDLRDVLVADPAPLRSFAKHLLVYGSVGGPAGRTSR